jgi:hypothetical protein
VNQQTVLTEGSRVPEFTAQFTTLTEVSRLPEFTAQFTALTEASRLLEAVEGRSRRLRVSHLCKPA